MQEKDWIQRRHAINTALGIKNEINLEYTVFPYHIVFSKSGSISITPDHQHFYFVSNQTMQDLNDKIMQDIKDLKYTALNQQLINSVLLIFRRHIEELRANDPAFDRYVLQHLE